MPTANEIRQQFIDFFCQKHGHTFVPSSPVVPFDDPTLLFTNAGMNQFKDVFLGTGTRPYKRAANTQKCIRAGGKHNDLDDVGKDTYHHTFFEMLGNWSFGDYFKCEAIRWAWQLLTDVWKIDKSRLHVTVFEGDPANGVPRDDEAAGFWQTEAGVAPSNIHFFGKKDNFWEMGETGPCGPCTEIHYDRTPDGSGGKLVNQGSPDVIEIWNLVFIQYNRNADQSLTPLPAKHVDTGMGFERITAVLQGKSSNYDTDVFTPIFDAIQQITKARPYGGKLDDLQDVAYRVIADHARMLTLSIADGAVPGSKGRGSVVRSVLRRGVRFGYQCFGLREPFLFKLVWTVADQMRDLFPDLAEKSAWVQTIIQREEQDFLQTVDIGIVHFDKAAFRAVSQSKQISGEDAFKLHETYGFPIDLTRQMSDERGLTVDETEFLRLKNNHEELSRQNAKKQVFRSVTWPGNPEKTLDYPKYDDIRKPLSALLLCWIKDGQAQYGEELPDDEEIALVLSATNFYAEQGGQIGDRGIIETLTGQFDVRDTQRIGDTILHIGRVIEGRFFNGRQVAVKVDRVRLDIQRNHTATHLLNLALKQSLGSHVEQKGSLVDDGKTRFDFSHDKPLSADELRQIEDKVNGQVLADLGVTAVVMPLAEAKQIPGVRAVFGEKYPDPVRVVMIGPDKPELMTPEYSSEFCGGTHVERTGSIGPFKIISQESVAKGVRRVTAVAGRTALAELQSRSETLDTLAAKLQCQPSELPNRLEALQDELKKLQAQAKKGVAADLAGIVDRLLSEAATVADAKIVVGIVPAAGAEAIRAQVDRIRSKVGRSVVIFGWDDEGKPGLLVGVTDDLVKSGLHAGKLVGEAAKIVEGKGGGNPTLAQAGGKNAAKLGDAIAHAAELVRQTLTKA